jgi:hypothetical protein
VTPWLIFGIVTVLNIIHSWPWLASPRVHGFFRFFAFETFCGLIFVQASSWFMDPFSFQQLFSWVFLAGSLVLAIRGLWLLHQIGKPRGSFEQTTVLITSGAYRYIRCIVLCCWVRWGLS